MFGNKSKSAATEPTVIGRGTVIEGTVRVSGRVQVDGVIDGSLVAEGPVSVGPSGAIIGELIALELAVGGRVEGRVSVQQHLHISPNGITRGEVRYGSLQVERGGVLDGSTARGEGTATLETAGEAPVSASAPALPSVRAANASG